MTKSVPPPDGSIPAYRAQYKVSPETKKFWEKLFHQPLSDKEVQEMTDAFVKNVCQQMQQVSKDCIEKMKELERERKEVSGG